MRDHSDFSQVLLGRIKAPHHCISKSSCLQMFYKGKSSLKFRKINRKTRAPECLCNKIAGLEPATLFRLKRRLQHKCLHVNFGNFFRRPNFVENLQGAVFGNAFKKKKNLNNCF